jgi:hypothetical protein
MRILLKCPTRSRPQKVMETLTKYVRLAAHPERLGVAVSCDEDDPSMTRNLVREDLSKILARAAWNKIFFSRNTSKIEACNANMNEIDWEWDIVVLVSDDMIPQIQGYDDIIRNHMKARFPDTDGILWFNDGFQGEKLNTLCVYGRAMYNRLGSIYVPGYKSLFCDTELTDRCKGDLADKCQYVPYCIIRHEHPGTGYAQNMDTLYATNQRHWNHDMYLYISRKAYATDISFLVPTIPGREASLNRLVDSIQEKMARIAPHTRYQIDLGFDNRETSIGAKRQGMVQNAKGKYVAFIDDDDSITDAYIEDVLQMIQGNYPVMRLRGQIGPYTFTHSLANTLSSPMARGEEFLRPPNHLNPMMTDVAKLVHYKDAIRGEDLDWTIRMARTGFLTHEYSSHPSRIHYIYNMGERKVDPGSLTFQQQTSYETMLSMVWTPNGPRVPDPPSTPRDSTPRLRLTARGFVSQ